MNDNPNLIDTNILIYALYGSEFIKRYLLSSPFISFVTEIEILGQTNIEDAELHTRQLALDYCTIIPFSNLIKKRTILLKQLYQIKLPDAIIAATAIIEGYTLISADRGFKKINELSLILLKVI